MGASRSLVLAILTITMLSAIPVLAQNVSVSETSSSIAIDGVLDMATEWNGSTVVVWSNPLDGAEYDVVYLLHNATHYLFAAVLYDPDNIRDDFFEIRVKWSSAVYRYVLSEGSSEIELYNITGGEEALSSNATGVMTSSRPSQHWLYLELAIPKEEWGSASTIYLLFIHRHTFKIDTTSKYPEDANLTDPSTWLRVDYKATLGEYKVVLAFRDRDGEPIDYVAGKSYAVISFANGTVFATIAPSSSSIEVLLPAENYTVTFYVYGIPIFRTELNVNSNITATYILNNLKHVVFPFGEVVAVVEHPGEISSIYLDPMQQLGMLIPNATIPVALRLFPTVSWNFTFVTALNALNFTFNPFTYSLLAYTKNASGIMMIGGPQGYPVFYYANGSVRGYVYNHEVEELNAWIGNGTYRIFHTKPPFAITLNNTALKRGIDYTVDPFNITTIVLDEGGELHIYYKNPTKVELTMQNSKAVIHVVTPYSFSGSYVVKIYNDNDLELVTSVTGRFTATVPMTIIEVPLDLDPGTYRIEVSVTDEDSKKLLGTAETTYEVEAIPIPGWEYYLLILVIVLLLIAFVAAIKASRHTIEEIRERRYVRKKGG